MKKLLLGLTLLSSMSTLAISLTQVSSETVLPCVRWRTDGRCATHDRIEVPDTSDINDNFSDIEDEIEKLKQEIKELKEGR